MPKKRIDMKSPQIVAASYDQGFDDGWKARAECMSEQMTAIMDFVRKSMLSEAIWWECEIRKLIAKGYALEDMELIEDRDRGARKLMHKPNGIPLIVVKPQSRLSPDVGPG
jgi:hypothetical protein